MIPHRIRKLLLKDKFLKKINSEYVVKNQVIFKFPKPIEEKGFEQYLEKISGKKRRSRFILKLINLFRSKKLFYPNLPFNSRVKNYICCWDNTLAVSINPDLFNQLTGETDDRHGKQDDDEEVSGETDDRHGKQDDDEEVSGEQNKKWCNVKGIKGETDDRHGKQDDDEEVSGEIGGRGGKMDDDEEVSPEIFFNPICYAYAKVDKEIEGLYKSGNGQINTCKNFLEQTSQERKGQKDKFIEHHCEIGIIDFGVESTHGEAMFKTVEKVSKDNVIIYNYNISNGYSRGSVMGICCQIARGISDSVDVLNISLGYYSPHENDLLKQYIKKAAAAGIFVVTSAGNCNNNNDCSDRKNEHHWPSNHSCYSNLLAVGAKGVGNTSLDINPNNKWEFTNYGKRTVSAYTSGIFDAIDMTPILTGAENSNHLKGTSISSAYIAGKVANLFALNGKANYINAHGFDKAKIIAEL